MSRGITIPFSRPSIDINEINAVTRVLKSGWLTTGQEAHLFEKECSEMLGVGIGVSPSLPIHSLAVQSATAGLHLAYIALGIDESSTVITSPINFISSISPAIHCGAKVAFVDTAPDSMYPDINALEKTEATIKNDAAHSVLSIVPIGGYHPHYDDFFAFAKEKKLQTVEDAAHTFPAEVYHKEAYRPYGTIADIGVYSFYANKTITTGEGGMIVSDNEDYIKTMALYRNHGMDKVAWDRYTTAPQLFSYDIKVLGYKYNMPDILAAIGREQLKKAKKLLEARKRIADYYYEVLSQRDYWKLPERKLPERKLPERKLTERASDEESNPHNHAWHLFVLQINHPHLTRDDFMKKLAEKGIGSSVHYTPLHLMTYFKNTYGYQPKDFPNAFALFKKIISIPLYADLDETAAAFVCETLIDIGDSYL